MGKNLLWSYRDFRRLLTSTLANDLSQSMSFIVVPLTVFASGGSATTAGIVTAVVTATGIVCQLFSGIVSDRSNPSVLIRISSLMQMTCWMGIALLQFMGQNNALFTGILASVAAAFASLSIPAEHTMLQRILPEDLYAKANAVTQGREAAANLLGAPLAGMIFSLSQSAVFGAQTILHLFAASTVPPAKTDKDQVSEKRDNWLADFYEGFRFVWNDKCLRTIVVAATIINIPLAMMPIAMISTYTELGYSEILIGLYLSMMGIGVLGGSAIAGRCIASIKPVLIGVMTIGLLFLTILATVFVYESLLFSSAVFLLGGVFLPSLNALIASYVMKITPEGLIGRVVSASGVPGMALMPVGSYLGGLLFESAGIQMTLIVAAVFAFISMLPLVISRSFSAMPLLAELTKK